MPISPDGVSPIFLHRLSIQRSQPTTKKLGDFRRPQGIVTIAIQALKFPAADILAEQELHWLATLRTGGRRGIFGHGMAHAG
jgi:hypothetical protein